MSPRSVSDLERGINRTARKDTAVLLAGALGLAGQARELFVAAARGRAPAGEALAAAGRGAAAGVGGGGHPDAAARYRQLHRPPGRARAADGAVGGGGRGGGGGGVDPRDRRDGRDRQDHLRGARRAPARRRFPDGQFFLPLHAHTPGQRPVDPADALASLLLTAGVAAAQIPPGLEARAGRWRDHVAGKKILLLLDDAAGHEQVRPLLPGTAGQPGADHQPAPAGRAGGRRRDQPRHPAPGGGGRRCWPGWPARPGLRAGDAAVGEITRLCGYLPLAIGMLARQLRHHPAWTAAGLAADLAAARDRLALMRGREPVGRGRVRPVLPDLPGGQQRLFRRLGLHPGPDIDAYAAAALDGTSLARRAAALRASMTST